MKIIKLSSAPPAYELYWNTPRPAINWDTPNGSWVGIWGYGWGDLIGSEVLKLTNKFEYEVWQPDLRADKVYSHTFSNGLIHRLFPAEKKQRIYGFKKIEYVVSQQMYDNFVQESKNGKIIAHLNGINIGVTRDIIYLNVHCPIVLEFLGEVKLPIYNILRPKKNFLAKISDIYDHFVIKKLFNRVDIFCCCNEISRERLEKYVKKEVMLIPVGIDCNLWRPRPDRNEIRKSLGLDNNTYVLLSSSRLNKLKQVDKIVEVLKKMDNDFEFLYIVTGHGTKKYEKYLSRVGERLTKKGKLKFVGYLPADELIRYYAAADMFVITSLSEGAPDAAKKALSMELPVFSTDTGYVAELLSRHNLGVVVPLRHYKTWEHELREILSGKKIKTMNRELVKSYFDWSNVAAQYIEMYNKLFTQYYR